MTIPRGERHRAHGRRPNLEATVQGVRGRRLSGRHVAAPHDLHGEAAGDEEPACALRHTLADRLSQELGRVQRGRDVRRRDVPTGRVVRCLAIGDGHGDILPRGDLLVRSCGLALGRGQVREHSGRVRLGRRPRRDASIDRLIDGQRPRRRRTALDRGGAGVRPLRAVYGDAEIRACRGSCVVKRQSYDGLTSWSSLRWVRRSPGPGKPVLLLDSPQTRCRQTVGVSGAVLRPLAKAGGHAR